MCTKTPQDFFILERYIVSKFSHLTFVYFMILFFLDSTDRKSSHLLFLNILQSLGLVRYSMYAAPVKETGPKAPTGFFRIMRESMDDGDIEITADVRRISEAMTITLFLNREKEGVIYTLYDDQGNNLF